MRYIKNTDYGKHIKWDTMHKTWVLMCHVFMVRMIYHVESFDQAVFLLHKMSDEYQS